MKCGTLQTASYREDGEQFGSVQTLIYHFTHRGARQSIRGLSHSAFGAMHLVATRNGPARRLPYDWVLLFWGGQNRCHDHHGPLKQVDSVLRSIESTCVQRSFTKKRSSLYHWRRQPEPSPLVLSPWPLSRFPIWLERANTPSPPDALASVRLSAQCGRPLGDERLGRVNRRPTSPRIDDASKGPKVWSFPQGSCHREVPL
jgi:hypothetical protein